MKNKLNQMIDQSTWPTPHSAASTSPPLFRDAHGRPAPDGEDAPGAEVSRHLRRVMSPAGPRPSTSNPAGSSTPRTSLAPARDGRPARHSTAVHGLVTSPRQ